MKQFLTAFSFILISGVYANTPHQGSLATNIQLPLCVDGKTVGSLSLKAGSEITIVKIESDGVLITRGESTPVKVSREAITSDSLAVAEATPPPVQPPIATPVPSIIAKPTTTKTPESSQMKVVGGNKVAVDCQTIIVPRKVAEAILAEYANGTQKISSNDIANSNHSTISKFTITSTTSGVKLDMHNGSDRLEVMPTIGPDNITIHIEAAFSNKIDHRSFIDKSCNLKSGQQVILGSFDISNYNSEIVFMKCDLIN